MINPNPSELVFSNEINIKETLKKLHESFPNLNLDELFVILDCVVLTTRTTFHENTNIRY